jgi:hypothetical protein
VTVTPAHDQTLTIRIIEHIPAHGDRGPAFEQAKQRMKQLGVDKCVIEGCDTGAPIEYHHSIIEHAWQEGVDVSKLDVAFGLHLTDDEFTAWVQSPGNLEPLCTVHHRTQLGVHALPEPLWNAVRVWRKDLPPPAEHVSGAKSHLPKGAQS